MRRDVLSLTFANMLDFALQFLMPIFLVRQLNSEDFSEYRLFWLVVGGAMAIAPFYIPRSLLYFLPRVAPELRLTYVRQSIFAMLLSGLAVAAFASPLNPFLGRAYFSKDINIWLLAVFLLTWIAASLADVLPNALGNVNKQAKVVVSFAVLRVAMVIGAATTGELRWVLVSLCLYSAIKLGFVFSVQKTLATDFASAKISLKEIKDQWAYVLPFGVASALFLLRGQADQWVAASLFSAREFAAFSIGVVIHPLVSLVRSSVSSAITPRLSALESSRDVSAMLRLNNRANCAVAYFVFPLLGLVWILAEHIVTIVYTANYIEAASVMRIYVFALLGVSVEVSTLTFVLAQGRFLVKVDSAMLGLAILFGYFGAKWFGLPGAALGGCVTLFAANAMSFWRVSRITAVPLTKLQNWSLIFRIMIASCGATVLVRVAQQLGLRLNWMLLDAVLLGFVFCFAYLLLLRIVGAWRSGVELIVGGRRL